MFHKFITGYTHEDDVRVNKYSLIRLSSIDGLRYDDCPVYNADTDEDDLIKCVKIYTSAKDYNIFELSIEDVYSLIVRAPKNVAFHKGESL